MMSQRLLGMLVAVMFAVAVPIANASTPCGSGQVASPCGDCSGGSAVNPYSANQGVIVDGGADAAAAAGGCCGQSVRYETRTI